MIDYALEAMRDCGIEPELTAMRGGTDGSWLSQANITAENKNAHGRIEFVPIQSMEKNTEIVLRLLQLCAENS